MNVKELVTLTELPYESKLTAFTHVHDCGLTFDGASDRFFTEDAYER